MTIATFKEALSAKNIPFEVSMDQFGETLVGVEVSRNKYSWFKGYFHNGQLHVSHTYDMARGKTLKGYRYNRAITERLEKKLGQAIYEEEAACIS